MHLFDFGDMQFCNHFYYIEFPFEKPSMKIIFEIV